jgi:hypothetical protein
MQVCLAETTYGKYGIGRSINEKSNGAINNIVGRKIHGSFYKWGAIKARLNDASFKHWTHSVLFYYEKMLQYKNYKRKIA